MEIAIGLHNELMRATITKYGGYEVKTEGDSFFVSFKDPAAAILCCSEIHISLMYVDWPESILQVSTSKEIRDPETGDLLFRGLRVRIGLHIGIPNAKLDPTTKRTDYFGTPVNTAARCSDQCPGAVTYITKDMYDFLSAYVGDVELEYPFCKSVGMFTFQGLSEQQQLYIILPNCLAGRSSRTIKNAKHDKEKENSGHAKRLSIVEQV
jgi:class 3 adenylate cyclase